MVVSDHYLKKYSHNPIQSCGVHLLGKCSELICFWAMLAQFWSSSGQKMTYIKWVKMLVSDHYPKKYSHNPFQTWCVHLLGDCSELISFSATLAKFCPSIGQKMTKKWCFLTIIWKSIHTNHFKLVVYTYWVTVHNWFAFRPRWPNFGPLVAKKSLKMVVSDHYLKKYSHNPIQT